MSQSLSKVYIHIIFSTKDRLPLISLQLENELFKYMYGILKNLDCPAIKIGGTPNHVHILNSLSRTITQSKMIAILKRDSTKWIKSKDLRFQNFHWQNGYGVFSICKTNITSLIKYIENQKDHHRTKSFKEEYLEFLQKYKIDFNDKYLWD